MRTPRFLAVVPAVLSLCLSATQGQEAPADAAPEAVTGAKAAVIETQTFGWTTQAILSSYVGGQHSEGYIDLLIPMLQGDDGMIFLYPRFGLSSDIDPGYSVGLGARQYLPQLDAIIGANVFYDRYGSAYGNYFNQLGLGLEMLTRWVDARFNYYIPDSNPKVIDSRRSTTRSRSTQSVWGTPFATGYSIRQPYTTTTTTTSVSQLFERFEDTMEGFDAEVGVLTPWLDRYVALRWFAGYFDFGNRFGADVNGFKGRAELRFSSRLAIDATYYENKRLTGDNWLFGVRMNIPVFMENLSDGRSPFTGSFEGMFSGVGPSNRGHASNSGSARGQRYPRSFASGVPSRSLDTVVAGDGGGGVRDRMTEEILRLTGARTSESDFLENLAKRDIDIDITRRTRIVVIDDTVVFVSNTRGTFSGPGTFENPLNTIQGGVNRASTLFGNRGDVFVAGTGTNYTEDVVDAGSSVKVWGGGRGFPVNGGRRFTYGSQPVLDGGFSIENVPQFSLSGFSIINGFAGGHGVAITDVAKFAIVANTISGAGQNGLNVGINSAGINVTGPIIGVVSGNTFTGNSQDGFNISIETRLENTSNLTVSNNVSSGNGRDGGKLHLNARTSNSGSGPVVNANITGNQFLGNTGDGLAIEADVHSTDAGIIVLNVANNTTNMSGGFGLNLDVDMKDGSAGAVVANIVGNNFLYSGLDGANIKAEGSDDSAGTAIINFSANNVADSGRNGLLLLASLDGATLSVTLSGNDFLNSGISSILLDAPDNGITYFSTLNNTSAGAGIGLALEDAGTGNSTGFILLDGATINFPSPGDIPD